MPLAARTNRGSTFTKRNKMNSKKFLDQLGLISLISKIKQALNGKQNVDMVVTIAQSGNAYSCDTSIANIVAAHDAGRDVYAVLPPVSDGSSTKIKLVEVQNYGSGTVMMVSFGDIINNGTNNVLYSVSGTRQNNLDAWSVSQKTMQEKLVSGTSIKTVNGNTLLGSGDVTINGSERVTATWNASTSAYVSGASVDDMYQSFYTDGKVLELELHDGSWDGSVLLCHGSYVDGNNARHLLFSGIVNGNLVEADVVGTAVVLNYAEIADVLSDLQALWADKQDKLTFDSTPILGSSNPVTSDGVYTALQGKQDTIGHNNKVDADFVEYRGADTSRLGNGDSMTEALQTLDNAITNLGTPNEIASITTQESSASGGNNVVTITDTDGTSTSFNVKNGKDGKDGADGVSLGEIALVQTAGDSEESVMSQKAVTERVERVSEEEIPNLGGVNRLPYGYLELAWIENGTSSRGAMLDTGLLPDDANWRFVGSWARTGGFNGAFAWVVGASSTNDVNTYLIQAKSTLITGVYVCAYQKLQTRNDVTLKSSAVDVWHDFDLKVGELVLDGTTVALGTDSSGTAVTTTMKLGSQYYPLMLGEFKAFHNDSLVADLVPCKRQSDDVIGMYDIVRNQFFASANAYNFIGGDVIGGGADKLINGEIMSKLVVQDTGTSVYKTMSQASITRKVERLGTGDLSLLEMSCKLPAGYTMVDYIDNVGMAYITTDIYLSTTDCRIVGKWKRTGGITTVNAVIVSKNNLAGNLAGYSLHYPTTSGGSVKVNGGSRIANGSVITLEEDLDVWHTYDLSHEILVLDGVSYDIDTTTANSSNNPMQICSTYLAMQIGLTKFYKGGELIGLFIPCISDTDEVGMYDAVSGVFYGSETSVGFEAGYEVTQLHDRLINGEDVAEMMKLIMGHSRFDINGQQAMVNGLLRHSFQRPVTSLQGRLAFINLAENPDLDTRSADGLSVAFVVNRHTLNTAPFLIINNPKGGGVNSNLANNQFALWSYYDGGWCYNYGFLKGYGSTRNVGGYRYVGGERYTHFVLTYEFSTGKSCMYRNGELVIENNTPSGYDEQTLRDFLATCTNMYVGAPRKGDDASMLGIALFGRVLTADEVSGIYNGGGSSIKAHLLPVGYEANYLHPVHLGYRILAQAANATEVEGGGYALTPKSSTAYIQFGFTGLSGPIGNLIYEWNFEVTSGTSTHTTARESRKMRWGNLWYDSFTIYDEDGNDVTTDTLVIGKYHVVCKPDNLFVDNINATTNNLVYYIYGCSSDFEMVISPTIKITEIGAALVCSTDTYCGDSWKLSSGEYLQVADDTITYATSALQAMTDTFIEDTVIYKSNIPPQFNGQIAVDTTNGKVYVGYLTGTGGTWKQVSN